MSNKQRKNTPADVKDPAALVSLCDLTKFVFKLCMLPAGQLPSQGCVGGGGV